MSEQKKLKAFYKGKKVLVTGGAGFIGSNLVDRLVNLGAKVTVVDNFSSGKAENLNKSLHKINLIVGDISSTKICTQALHSQDVVFHTAAVTSVSQYEKNPLKCDKINIKGTEQLLKHCKGISCFVFSSSAAVYGKTDDASNESSALNPISQYGKSKALGEALCKKYSQELGFKSVVLRYFNVYGHRQKTSGCQASVVSKFINSLIEGTKLTIFGDGKQTRDFVHVSKIIQANILTAAFSSQSFDIFNVASGKSINLIELLERLENNLGKKRTQITFQENQSSDIDQSMADCRKYIGFIESIQDFVDQNVFIEPDIDIHSDSA